MALHIDQADTIFELRASRACEERPKLPVCGVLAVGGCGVAPHGGSEFFVKVSSKGAIRKGPPTKLEFKVARCVELMPKGGFAYPP